MASLRPGSPTTTQPSLSSSTPKRRGPQLDQSCSLHLQANSPTRLASNQRTRSPAMKERAGSSLTRHRSPKVDMSATYTRDRRSRSRHLVKRDNKETQEQISPMVTQDLSSAPPSEVDEAKKDKDPIIPAITGDSVPKVESLVDDATRMGLDISMRKATVKKQDPARERSPSVERDDELLASKFLATLDDSSETDQEKQDNESESMSRSTPTSTYASYKDTSEVPEEVLEAAENIVLFHALPRTNQECLTTGNTQSMDYPISMDGSVKQEDVSENMFLLDPKNESAMVPKGSDDLSLNPSLSQLETSSRSSARPITDLGQQKLINLNGDEEIREQQIYDLMDTQIASNDDSQVGVETTIKAITGDSIHAILPPSTSNIKLVIATIASQSPDESDDETLPQSIDSDTSKKEDVTIAEDKATPAIQNPETSRETDSDTIPTEVTVPNMEPVIVTASPRDETQILLVSIPVMEEEHEQLKNGLYAPPLDNTLVVSSDPPLSPPQSDIEMPDDVGHSPDQTEHPEAGNSTNDDERFFLEKNGVIDVHGISRPVDASIPSESQTPCSTVVEAVFTPSASEVASNSDCCGACKRAVPNMGSGARSHIVSTLWIRCDGCKTWYHNVCVQVSEKEVNDIDKYHCSVCVPTLGPTTYRRKSSRVHTTIDYVSLNEGSSAPFKASGDSAQHPFVEPINRMQFLEDNFPRVSPEMLTIEYFGKGDGFKTPVVVPSTLNPRPGPRKMDAEGPQNIATQCDVSAEQDISSPSKISSTAHNEEVIPSLDPSDALGMVIPSGLTVRKVAELVGFEEKVEVLDVLSQSQDKKVWDFHHWVDYFESPSKDNVKNVISQEFSHTKLATLIRRPDVVEKLDLAQKVWPKDQVASFPKVKLYCLMSVGGSYTDFHIDFGGSSVFYHIVSGKKTFLFVPPTKYNLNKYEAWSKMPEQNSIWYPGILGANSENGEKLCCRVDLNAGDTMLIPSGWIHAVLTPEDSLVIGGNFLTPFSYEQQLKIVDIEKATNVHIKFRYPSFQKVMWYTALNYIQNEPLPEDLYEKESLETNSTEPSLASKHELDGLPHLAEFLLRTALISMGVITDVTAEKRNRVKSSIPKVVGDPLSTVQLFGKWVAWKRQDNSFPYWTAKTWVPGVVPAGLHDKRTKDVKQKRLSKGKEEKKQSAISLSGDSVKKGRSSESTISNPGTNQQSNQTGVSSFTSNTKAAAERILKGKRSTPKPKQRQSTVVPDLQEQKLLGLDEEQFYIEAQETAIEDPEVLSQTIEPEMPSPDAQIEPVDTSTKTISRVPRRPQAEKVLPAFHVLTSTPHSAGKDKKFINIAPIDGGIADNIRNKYAFSSSPKNSILGPRRTACDDCRRQKVACKHKDLVAKAEQEILTEITKPIIKYTSKVKRQTPPTTPSASSEMSQQTPSSLIVTIPLALKASQMQTTFNPKAAKAQDFDDLNSSPSYKISKNGRPVACESCKKSRRRCTHNGQEDFPPARKRTGSLRGAAWQVPLPPPPASASPMRKFVPYLARSRSKSVTSDISSSSLSSIDSQVMQTLESNSSNVDDRVKIAQLALRNSGLAMADGQTLCSTSHHSVSVSTQPPPLIPGVNAPLGMKSMQLTQSTTASGRPIELEKSIPKTSASFSDVDNTAKLDNSNVDLATIRPPKSATPPQQDLTSSSIEQAQSTTSYIPPVFSLSSEPLNDSPLLLVDNSRNSLELRTLKRPRDDLDDYQPPGKRPALDHVTAGDDTASESATSQNAGVLGLTPE